MIIGIDIGGTSIKFGLFQGDKLIQKTELPSKGELVDVIKEGIEKLTDGRDVDGIGVTVPAPTKDNYMFKAANLSWSNMNVKDYLSKELGIENISVMNDANAAALGEYKIAGDYDSAIMITLGTGVGGGIIVDGKVLEGHSGFGGEIGHIKLDQTYNFECGCGGVGCVETISSATGLSRLYKHYTGVALEAKEIFDLAKAKDSEAMRITEIYIKNIAHMCQVLSVTTNPEIFIIGGGVSKAGSILLEGIVKHFKEFTSFKGLKEQQFKLAELGNDAGIYGAYYSVKK